ncbi:MAG: ABC transporter ATP-binding protein/permease [Clostridiales bacterium]|nr:ABC transporter ATP-binding protein/permease [Clostridiales bacterium]
MIELKNICKEYISRRRKTRALNNIDLTLGERGMVCLLGESGCGKTTLLNILGTLDSPSYGDILIDGKNLVHMRESERNAYRATQIGFIFQELNLIEDLTVRDNLLLVCNKEEIDATHRETLQKLKIDEFADKLPKELSGGQRQRVAIARAIVKGSRILLCDEPTGSLDPDNAVMIFETLKEIARERLVVVVSHDVATASKYADRIIRLHNGEVQSDTENENVAKNAAPQETAPAVLARPKAKQRVRGVFGLSLRYLKCKPARLTIMAVISVLIFTLLSVIGSVSSYNAIALVQKTMRQNDIRYFTVSQEYQGKAIAWDVNDFSYIKGTAEYSPSKWSDNDIRYLENIADYKADRIYDFYSAANYNDTKNDSVYGNLPQKWVETFELHYRKNRGIVHMTSDLADRYGFILHGALPQEVNDVVIGGYTFALYKLCGYTDGTNVTPIRSYTDIIGKTIEMKDSRLGTRNFTVTGVLDTHFDEARYDCTKKYSKSELKTLEREFENIEWYGSPHNILYVSDAFMQEAVQAYDPFSLYDESLCVYKNTDLQPVMLHALPDIRSAAGGKVYYANGMDDNTDTIIYGSENFLTQEDLQGLDADGVDALLRKTVEENAEAYANLNIRSDKNDFVCKTPFGGIYFNADDPTDAVFTQNNVVQKLYNDMRAYISASIRYNVSAVYNVLMPAKNANAAKRLLQLDEKAQPYTEDKQLLFEVNRATYQTQSIVYDFRNEATKAVDKADAIFRNVAKYMTYAFLGMTALTLLVVYLYFSALLGSREKDVGVLRTNGYTKGEIALLFIFEAAMLSGIFIVLSVALSAVSIPIAGFAFKSKFGLLFTPVSFTFAQVGMIAGFQLLFAALGILLPLLILLRKRPMQIINAGK